MVVRENKILRKPKDKDKSIFCALSALRTVHQVILGLAVIDTQADR